MSGPGQRLRYIRERLQLKYRDVEQASQEIAERHGSEQFQVGLSRLADIETKGTVPSIYRLYSLAAIYRLDFTKVLSWYGIELGALPGDAASIQLERTNVLDYPELEKGDEQEEVEFPDDGLFAKTFYLSRHVQVWGKLPRALLANLEVAKHRYAFIGLDDWFMYPLLRPGSFVQVDESRNKIAADGWSSEWDRPIYLIEHRGGLRCGWCSLRGHELIMQPHPSTQLPPDIYRASQTDVIGQVVGIAMRLDPGKRRRTGFSIVRE